MLKVIDSETHIKRFHSNQMMLTKLSKFDPDLPMGGGGSLCDFHYNALIQLKSICEANDYFFGDVRIPKFEFERIDDHTILNRIEFLFGRQLTPVDIVNNDGLIDLAWEGLVINEKDNKVCRSHLAGGSQKRFAFTDFQADNFIMHGEKKLGQGARPWKLAYVDLESFLTCTKEESESKFIQMALGFKNYRKYLGLE